MAREKSYLSEGTEDFNKLSTVRVLTTLEQEFGIPTHKSRVCM